MPYRIGPYLIDPEAYEIRHDGNLVSVEPQVFDLLIMLIENRHRAVGKDEIIERVWKGRVVSDATLSSRIKSARQALGDDGSTQKLIRTIHGRGFRFVGDVEEIDPPVAAETNGSAAAPNIGGVAAKPTGLRKWVIAAAALGVLGAGVLTDQVLVRPTRTSGDDMLEHAAVPPASSGARETTATFKDCDVCPEMVMLPAGTFMMGSPEDERGREKIEGPPRPIVIARRFALGRLEVTVEQFAVFVAETGAGIGSACNRVDSKTARWGPAEGSFRQPGFDVTGSHPAVCVSWHEARAYAAWLSRRTGKPYRLPSEAEWEYAARAGTTSSYSFGSDETRLCEHARFADLGSQFSWRGACRSEQASHGPVQVGAFKPNAWGFFDMHGNAWEWAADCWTADPREIPADATAFTRPGACEIGVVRGGSWAAEFRKLRSAQRMPVPAASRLYHTGFRVALTLGSP
jgi:formylglycine-generating enzyme required for sulfatase activity